MADAAKAAVSGVIEPGIGIVKSWQGIVEIALRAGIVVLSLIIVISGGTCQSAVGEIPTGGLADQALTGSAAGWLMFVGVLLMIYEVVMIVQRFLNVRIINQHISIVIIIDAIVSFVVAFLIFCSAVALAVYNPRWQALVGQNAFFDGVVNRIIGATGAASFFGFMTLLVLIGKGVFMILGGMVFNWGPTKAKYESSGSSSAPV